MWQFLLSEEWWMEALISALITGVCTVIAAAIYYNHTIAKISEGLSKLQSGDTVAHNNLINNAQNLSKEHENLSKEHGSLSKEHEGLSKEHGILSREHSEIKADVKEIRDYTTEERARRELLEKIDEQKLAASARLISDSVEHLLEERENVNERINALKEENLKLELENKVLKGKVTTLEKQLEKGKNADIEPPKKSKRDIGFDR